MSSSFLGPFGLFILKEGCILFSSNSPCSHYLGWLKSEEQSVTAPSGTVLCPGFWGRESFLLSLATATVPYILRALGPSPQRGCGP